MKLNYCTECAASFTKQSDTKYVCENGHEYFNNPRAACTVIFINDKNELLYAKRGREPAKDKYDFPGGFLDYGEDAYEAMIREIQEEMGVSVAAEDLKLIDAEANHYQENVTTCDFIFVCRNWQGDMKADDDVATLEWKSLDFLKSDQFAWAYPHLFAKLPAELS